MIYFEKVIYMFNLKETEKILVECLNKAKIADKKKKNGFEDDGTFYRIKMPPFHSFPFNKEINQCISKSLEKIMADEPIKTNLPRNYIQEKIEDMLALVFNAPEDEQLIILHEQLSEFREAIKKKLNDEISDYKFILHVNKLNVQNELAIGNVNFYKLDEEKANEIKVEEIKKKSQFINWLTGGIGNFLNTGGTYAEVKTRGLQDYAYSLALYQIRLSLNIIKLFIHPMYCVFGLDGESMPPMHRKSILTYDNDEFFIRVELVGSGHEYFLDEESLEFMNNHGLIELNKILKKESKLSKYENNLLTGIYWFGESVSITADYEDIGDGRRSQSIDNLEFVNRGEKLLKLFTSLEAVLNFNNEEKITETIAERAALLIVDDYKTRIEIKRNIKKIYGDRSKMVHQGVTYVSELDLEDITVYTRAVLQKLIELKTEYNFSTSKELNDYIEILKLGTNDDLKSYFEQKS